MAEMLFLGLTLLFVLLFYFATGRNKGVLLINIGWSLIIGTVALVGSFASYPQSFILALVATLVVHIFIFRKIGRQQPNVVLLLLIHVLRIAVELFLYELYLDKMIPRLMTFRGLNFDIVIGLFALVFLIAYLFQKSIINSWVFVLWNYLGILSLLIVVMIGVLSSPVPIQQFGFEQPNVAVLGFPYGLLPTIIVPIAIVSHLLLLRRYRSTNA